jgi:hypothetical protein
MSAESAGDCARRAAEATNAVIYDQIMTIRGAAAPRT